MKTLFAFHSLERNAQAARFGSEAQALGPHGERTLPPSGHAGEA
jgi:hypothetical protein